MNEIEKAIDELEKLSRYAEILKSPDEFFHHMQGHRTELSLVLSAFGIAEMSKDIKAALEKQLTGGWIPCKERLPEEYGCYLVAWRPVSLTAEDVAKNTGTVSHYYEIAEYDPDDEALWIGGIEQCKEYEIFAWQPLPEPFKGGENE